VKGIFKFFIEEKNIFFVHTTVLSLKTAFNLVIKGKTSYGRHYHKFCSWRATISTILNNATAQYFPVATHAADTKQFKFNIT
jgi:hypothetical protein